MLYAIRLVSKSRKTNSVRAIAVWDAWHNALQMVRHGVSAGEKVTEAALDRPKALAIVLTGISRQEMGVGSSEHLIPNRQDLEGGFFDIIDLS